MGRGWDFFSVFVNPGSDHPPEHPLPEHPLPGFFTPVLGWLIFSSDLRSVLFSFFWVVEFFGRQGQFSYSKSNVSECITLYRNPSSTTLHLFISVTTTVGLLEPGRESVHRTRETGYKEIDVLSFYERQRVPLPSFTRLYTFREVRTLHRR